MISKEELEKLITDVCGVLESAGTKGVTNSRLIDCVNARGVASTYALGIIKLKQDGYLFEIVGDCEKRYCLTKKYYERISQKKPNEDYENENPR